MNTLSNDDVQKALKELNGWQRDGDSILKEYELKDFTDAIGFVTQIGIVSEKADHHPTILIHSWNKVKVTLSTHDAGGITDKDISLAKTLESF